MDISTLIALAAACAPLVDPGTVRSIVAVESGFNAYAIGVLSGMLDRQPRSRAEAVATARKLNVDGWNYSVGLAQINVRNFVRLGLTAETAIDPCRNLAAMQVLLIDCFDRATRRGGTPQRSIRQALSCYYSGNFVTGFDHGYVRRVINAAVHAATHQTPALVHAKESST